MVRIFCSLLHVCLTMDTVLERLNNTSDVELPSKTLRGVRDNTIRCLLALKGNPGLIKQIYDFAKVHFQCWRKAVNSTGKDLFKTALETSKLYATIGVELDFDTPYFSCINRHLYNTDGVFLPLSTDTQYMTKVYEILKIGLEEKWVYSPAPFKSHLQYDFSRDELCELDVSRFTLNPEFCRRVYCSPLFKHVGDVKEVIAMYQEGICESWENKSSLIPGHNQRCERLIGDLKRSININIDTLVTISVDRNTRQRFKGNVSKGLE